MKKQEKMIILDLTKKNNIPTIPAYHSSPLVKIFEFWTEKGEQVNNMKRITHDTQKIAIKTHEGIQSVTIPDSMQKNLLEYFKFKNKKVFKNFTCHELSHYIVHRTTNRNYKYKIKKMNNFEIGDTILLGTFVKILGKTFVLDVIHSAIYVAQTQEGPLFISKLGRRELVVITTLSELQKIYYDAPNCAKQIWI